MPPTTTDIRILRVEQTPLGLVLVAGAAGAQVVQCYLSGELAGWQEPVDGSVQFVLPQTGPQDSIALLAVERGDERTNYYRQAFDAAAPRSSRIQVALRRDLLDGRAATDTWRVCRSAAGGSEADIVMHEACVYPGGDGSCGWGCDWGGGGWGFSGSAAPGWGSCWGYTWGFGIDYLEAVSDPLPRGVYVIRAEIEDARGNVSRAFEASVVVEGYAAPARDLAVESYDPATDTLVLSMTSSEDI